MKSDARCYRRKHREGMIDALAMLSNAADGMAEDNLGMEPDRERLAQSALRKLAQQLQRRCANLQEKSDAEQDHKAGA